MAFYQLDHTYQLDPYTHISLIARANTHTHTLSDQERAHSNSHDSTELDMANIDTFTRPHSYVAIQMNPLAKS